MSRTSIRTELALWLALLAGFSPVLVQFARFEAWFPTGPSVEFFTEYWPRVCFVGYLSHFAI